MDNEQQPQSADEPTGRIFPNRNVPQWIRIAIWVVVGIVFFPMGMFICLALAKAMRWWLAILLVVLSLAVFGGLRVIANVTEDPGGLAWFLLAVGLYQYRIGERHGLWGRVARTAWKTFGWIGLIFAVLVALTGYFDLLIPPEYR